MPWEAVNGNYAAYNVDLESADSNSLLNWYKKLIAVRHANPVLCRGTYFNVNSGNDGIYSFMRSYNDKNALVVINMRNQLYTGQGFDLTGAGVTDGAKIISELLSGTGFMDSISGQQLNNLTVQP